MQKILIIGPAWVGDMVMAQCLFKLLKAHSKDLVIDVLAPHWTFGLLSRMPQVASAIALPFSHGDLKIRDRYRLALSLRANHYSQAIVLPNSLKSSLVPWFARIPKRTGWIGECRYGVLNDLRYLDKHRYPLMIERFMALGLPSGVPLPKPYPTPELQVSYASQAAVLAKHRLTWHPDRPVLAISAGAAFGSSKRWPETYFAEIANKKLSEGWAVWLFGSENDRPVTEKIMALTHHRCDEMTGRMDLAETIDLLSLVSGLITNDSGLMHVAAALNKPIIAIYGSTSPECTPPLTANAAIVKLNLPCQPCFKRICPLKHHRCMREISPERVLKAMARRGI